MRLRSLLAAAALVASSLAAHADTIDYTLTGGGITYTFSLDQNPLTNPGFYATASDAFVTNPITVEENGTPVTERIQFAAAGNPNGYCEFALNLSNSVCDANSDNFYSGSSSNPTLLTGTFKFTNSFGAGEAYTLTATDASMAVTPEPSSIALLGTGLLGMGGLLRKRYTGA